MGTNVLHLPITITVVVDDIATVLATYDQIQIHRSTSGESGPFVEISTSATRVDLEAAVSSYEFVDTAGSDEFWYKTRYYHSSTLAVSGFTDPQPGALDPALDVISITELKTNFLFGLDLTDDAGNPYPDSLYAYFIKNAVSWLEHRLDIPIVPMLIEEERHDFFRDDYNKFIFLTLDYYPVIGIESVTLVLPGEQIVKTFEQSWIHIQRNSGQLQMLPGTGTAGSILLGASAAWIPFIYGSNSFLPDAFRVKYEAGFGKGGSHLVSPSDRKLDSVPGVIAELVGKIASFGPLNIAGDLLGGAGIASQSISLDGLSQSFNTTSSATNAGYGARLIQYQKEIKEKLPVLQAQYKGNKLVIV